MTPTPHDSPESPAHPDIEWLLLDVRSQGEFDAGHLECAVHLPLDQLAARIAELVPERQRPLLAYCASGARSGMACQWLQQLGYTQVQNGGGIGLLAMQLQRPIRRA